MIEIDKLHNYLNQRSRGVGRDYTFHIPEDKIRDGHIYGKYIMDGKYGFLGKSVLPLPEWANLSHYMYISDKALKRNSFTNAILSILMPEYRYFDIKSRINFVNDLHRQIGYDMEEKSLYKDMGYVRIRKEIREKFINCLDLDDEEKMKQVIVDYFSLTVYEISKTDDIKFGNKMEIKSYGYVPMVWRKTERNEEYKEKNLVCFLLKMDGKYFAIVRKNTNGIFDFQENIDELVEKFSQSPQKATLNTDEVVTKNIVKKLPENIENVAEEVERIEDDIVREDEIVREAEKEKKDEKVKILKIPKKISLAHIQKIALEYGVELTRPSEKTGKMLKKTIEELREEIEFVSKN